MKKLLFISLFSTVLMASTTIKEGIVTNKSKEVSIEKTAFKEDIYENNMFFGCGSEANGFYDIWRGEGYSHREARSLRRAWVRKCRGNGPDGWLSGILSWG